MVEQAAGVARVFRQNHVNRFQDLDGTEGNVAEVADRRAYEKQPTRYAACSLNFTSSCCFGTAPMTWSTTFPSLKNSSVGIDLT